MNRKIVGFLIITLLIITAFSINLDGSDETRITDNYYTQGKKYFY